MFKSSLVLALALTAALVAAQEPAPGPFQPGPFQPGPAAAAGPFQPSPAGAPGQPGQEAAAEPYSYGYQTDSHAASEQRDPSGKVTGFYTISGEDGRERRVEYYADESGFHAKVATNEIGTKSSFPADVEVTASEPTAAQYSAVQYQQQAPPPQPQVQFAAAPPKVVQQTQVVQRPPVVQQGAIRSQVNYVQQPGQAYYATNGYGSGAYYGQTGYGAGYGTGYGYYAPGYGSGQTGYLTTGNYNNHLPSQYYRSISTTSGGAGGPVPAAGYSVANGQNVRYIAQPGVGGGSSSYRSVSYGPATVTGATPTRTIGGAGAPGGSSNYIVLAKRAAVDDTQKSS